MYPKKDIETTWRQQKDSFQVNHIPSNQKEGSVEGYWSVLKGTLLKARVAVVDGQQIQSDKHGVGIMELVIVLVRSGG